MYKWLIVLLMALCAVPLSAQPHLSEMFELEAEHLLDTDSKVFQAQGMVGCVDGDALLCCHRRGFQNKETGYKAEVVAIDLITGKMSGFLLPLPEKKANAPTARKYWIRGFFVAGNQLLVTTQNEVLVYHKGKANRCEFVRRIPADLPDLLFWRNGTLASVERVPEEGRFVIKRQGERVLEWDSVTGLQLRAPFLLQYEPNGFVDGAGNCLYFLDSPDLRIEKLSLEGETLAVIRPQIPGWQALPDELVRKISSMPYGSDRAMYTFYHTKEYSFPLKVHPLCDSILMLSYHHYDPSVKQEQMLTTLVYYDKEGKSFRVSPYSHFFAEDSVIGSNMFPLYFAQRELCLQVEDGDRIVQVVREAPVGWRGKTGRAYADSVENYLSSGLPEYRVRVAKLKACSSERRCVIGSLGLQTYGGSAFDGKELARSKVIFVVNNPPQCHDCEESLFGFISAIDTSLCKVCVVFNNADSYLAKQDMVDKVQKRLSVPFTPLFVPTEEKEGFIKKLNGRNFPVVMLKEAGGEEAVVVAEKEIFAEGVAVSRLQEGFVRKVMLFLHRNASAAK